MKKKRNTKPAKWLIAALLLIGFLLMMSGVRRILEEKKTLYRYDVARDYHYSFSNAGASISRLDLKEGVIFIPALSHVPHTVLLEFEINSSLMGHLFQPGIRMKNRSITCDQYFEYGAKGKRYLNISPLIGDGPTELHLSGRFLSFTDQTATLIVMTNDRLDNQKILVLSPHPDDAEIAAYGLYSSNKDSYIVTITAGDAGVKPTDAMYHDAAKFYSKKGKLRVWNSITTPLLGGISPEKSINLGYYDGTLKTMHLYKYKAAKSKYSNLSDINLYRRINVSSIISKRHATSTWRSLVGDIQFLLSEIKPDIIVTPYPAIDKHPDHKYTTIALFEALTNLNLKNGSLYFYTNHHVLSAAYPFGPTGSLISLPPNFDDRFMAEKIYSYALTEDRQKDKWIVLETMSDLRTDNEMRTIYGLAQQTMKRIKNKILGQDLSYFRRAVRSNELFFVMEIKEIYNDEVRRKLE